ncbi:MAG: D-sedoheptulose 7-phosphate isomerase [Bacteroidota bacterium]|jgi:D-sedoheptulose 7-phosphate isomerase
MDSSTPLILSELRQASDVLENFISKPQNLEMIEQVSKIMIDAFKNGNRIYSAGNGGSHCDAMHFAEELTGRYREDRKPYPAIAIAEPAYLSCTANDYGFDRVFSRYLEAHGVKGDIFLAISTSGNSVNILKAAEMARMKGMKVVALTGNNGGKLSELADYEISVAHIGYADRIQEIHIKIIHILILLIEQGMA